jgi:predicted transcriptional regulator
MKAKYKSEPLGAILESMKDLYEIGLLSEESGCANLTTRAW